MVDVRTDHELISARTDSEALSTARNFDHGRRSQVFVAIAIPCSFWGPFQSIFAHACNVAMDRARAIKEQFRGKG
jgi:hypothetical protein